jgi:hypothetical protein
VAFCFLTGIRFVLTIADDFQAFSYPINRIGNSTSNRGIFFLSALASRISDPACPV